MTSCAATQCLAFETCYQAHRERVFHWGLRFGGGRAAWAEDLTHDVFLKLLEKLPELTNHDDLGGWLYRVTANLAISRLRRDRSLLSRLKRIVVSAYRAFPASPQVAVEQKEAARAALESLKRLPERERVVLCMKVLDGKSQKEIADALSMSEGYVSKLISRALETIRALGWEVSDA